MTGKEMKPGQIQILIRRVSGIAGPAMQQWKRCGSVISGRQYLVGENQVEE
jgi:hypothetical protein